MVESFVLSSIGAAAGLVLAKWGSEALVAQLATSATPVFLEMALDWRVMAFTAALMGATAVLFGTAPALLATRAAPIDAMKEPGFAHRASAPLRHGGGPVRFGARGLVRRSLGGGGSSGLVVVQVALSLVLGVVAGLFVRTFTRLTALPLGFDSDRLLVVSVNTTRTVVAPSNRVHLYGRLVAASAAVPGVAHAAGSMVTPVSGDTSRDRVEVRGAPVMPDREHFVLRNAITPGWFAAYGTPLRAGRDVDDRDVETAPAVIVVNDAFVRKFFPGRNPIGGTVGVLPPPGAGPPPPPKTIVGVVGDAVYRSLREDAQPTVYVPLAQSGSLPPTVTVSIRSAGGSPTLLAPSVAAALTAVDRDLAFAFRPLRDQVDASLTQERLVAMLSGFFGVLALLLAAVGLYGVTAYAAGRRRVEIGIRMALGAQRSDIIGLVLGQSVAITAAGIVLGFLGAGMVTRYIGSMLFGVTPLDPATFVAVGVLFACVAALASYVPARRATHVDPLIALRCE
jgi:predicted permease